MVLNRIQRAWRALTAQPEEQLQHPFPLFVVGRGGAQRRVPRLVDYQTYVEEGFAQNAVIYAALMYKARAMALTRMRVYEGDRDTPDPVDPSHPLSRLMERPNPHMSQLELLMSIMTTLNLDGNAYIYMERGSGSQYPKALWPLRPDSVEIRATSQKELVYVYSPSQNTNQSYPIVPDDLMHIKFPNPGDPYEGMGYGLSPLSPAAKTVDIDNLMTNFFHLLFDRNGVMPGGFIEFDGLLDDDVLLQLRNQFTEQYGGADQWGKPIAISDGGKYKPATMSFKDMGADSIDSRNERRTLAPFGVPGMLIGLEMEHSTFANFSQAQENFWQTTMLSEMNLIEDEFQWKLRLNDIGGAFVSWDTASIPAMQENVLEQSQAYAELVKSGVPPNMAKQAVGLTIPDIPGGDKSYMPGSYTINGEFEVNPTTDRATPAGAVATDEEEEDEIQEAAAAATEEMSRMSWSGWDYEQKQRIGKAMDDITEAWEAPFRRQAAEQFRKDKAEVEAILSEQKSRALTTKATINWTDVRGRINNYLSANSMAAWRTGFAPLVIDVVKSHHENWRSRLPDRINPFNLRNVQAEVWFAEHQLIFSRNVTNTTRENIHGIISSGLAEGHSTDKIAQNIGHMFDQYMSEEDTADWTFMSERRPRYRLETIARTETHAAASAGNHQLFKDANASHREWLATRDDRTRATHMEAWDKYSEGGTPGPIPLDIDFVVGGSKLRYPGDKRGALAETINCRCVELPYFDEDETIRR